MQIGPADLRVCRNMLFLIGALHSFSPISGSQCSLIVTEGDSAKALAVAGLEVGRHSAVLFLVLVSRQINLY